MIVRAPKPWRWLRAHIGGYFWLPCDVCDRMFSGHEQGNGMLIMPGDQNLHVTCPLCPHDYAVTSGGRIGRISARRDVERGWVPIFIFDTRAGLGQFDDHR